MRWLFAVLLPVTLWADPRADQFVQWRFSRDHVPGHVWFVSYPRMTNALVEVTHLRGFKSGDRIIPVGLVTNGVPSMYSLPSAPGNPKVVQIEQLTILAGEKRGWIDTSLLTNSVQAAALTHDMQPYELFQTKLGPCVRGIEVVIPDADKLAEMFP